MNVTRFARRIATYRVYRESYISVSSRRTETIFPVARYESVISVGTEFEIGDIRNVEVFKIEIFDVFINLVAIFIVNVEVEVYFEKIVNRVQRAVFASTENIDIFSFRYYSRPVFGQSLFVDGYARIFEKRSFAERYISLPVVGIKTFGNGTEFNARSLFEKFREFGSRPVESGSAVFGKHYRVRTFSVLYEWNIGIGRGKVVSSVIYVLYDIFRFGVVFAAVAFIISRRAAGGKRTYYRRKNRR